MAFTYLGDLSTDLDKVRFYVQDTVENSGPKPNDGNFTDAELEALITLNGDWERAVAAVLDTLATIWARYVDIKAGPHSESLSQTAKAFREQAKAWRTEHQIYAGVQVAGVIRVDGYSDDVTSDDVDATTEYAKVKVRSWEYPL